MATPSTPQEMAQAAAPTDVQGIITDIARQLGVDPQLALAIARQESGLNPNAIGDNGHSVGLFQLNDQGEGAGMSVGQRQDPRTNARIALTQVAAVVKAHPDWSPGQIAAAAQRPADQTGYAAAINTAMGQPTDTTAGMASGLQNVPPQTPFDPNQTYPAMSAADHQWLMTNAGQDAWMLTIPELANIVNYAAHYRISDANEVTALLQQTNYYRTHSDSVQSAQKEYATNPATWTQDINQLKADIGTQSSQMGLQLTDDQLSHLAFNSKYYAWDSVQLTKAISQFLSVTQAPTAGQALVDFNTLKAQAQQTWGVPASDQQLATWVQQIEGGQQTVPGVEGLLRSQAMSLYPTLTDQFNRGFNFQQITDPYKQIAQQYLNVDPATINFTDPKWMAALSQVGPNGQRQEMGLDQWTNYIRSNPAYGFQNTTMAKNQAYDQANNLAIRLGVVAQ